MNDDTSITILDEYEKFAKTELIQYLPSKMKGCIYEGHYFAYIQANPFDICLKRSKIPKKRTKNRREFINTANSEEIQECTTFSEFLGGFGRTTNLKSFTMNIKIREVVPISVDEFDSYEIPPISQGLDDNVWRLHLPEDPNFPAIDGILQGTITDEKEITHEIIILDQVTVSSPINHCNKARDPGRLLLTDYRRNMDQEENHEEEKLIIREKFQYLFKRVETTENCHLFWKWTLKNPDQKVLDSYPLTDLGRTQSTHGPPDGMTARYVTGKK